MRRHRVIFVAFVLVATAMFAACGGSDDANSAADTSTAGDDASASATGGVVSTVDGGQFDFNDLQGQPALLWFWAPW